MDLAYFITTLGLIPYFTSRAFIPLFATALTARFGPDMGFLAQDVMGIQLLEAVPAWTTSNTVLWILGGFTVLEILLNKNPDLRELLSLTDSQLKGLAALSLCLVLASAEPSQLAAPLAQAGLLGDLSFAHFWALSAGATVWFLATLRNAIYGFLMEMDEDDDLGLQKLLSWMEDGIGFVGVLFVVILPMAALAVTGVTVLGLYLLRKYLEHREEKQKVPCPTCASPNSPCGIHCAQCNQPRTEVRQVGWMGTVRQAVATDLEAHRFQLRAQKRCHHCGERLRGRQLDLQCQLCHSPCFAHRGELEAYVQCLQGTLPRALLILLVLGAIPLVGLIPGILYYRLSLISSLRRYLPRSTRFFSRWLVRGINLVLICLQPVPFFGAFTLPLLCLSNFWIYRHFLLREGQAKLSLEAAASES
ncbi:MAG: hypothetical protein SX243_05640 [Acidobacteriota bacterium]|nr:hypothetical protein [Acidobacteriota bacterium]